ncbi:MAG: RluA family pseudouridine synthase [Lachnospiraceae bacterium]|nr:RluA family pseudouridine synthase [Lachnospiraceae bacterium]
MNVLFEDKYILVCEKPAGTPTQAGKITEKDMVSEVNNYMRKAGAKASAYLIHRLDKPVRGILVFAKTKEAAAGLNTHFEGFDKRYIAIVEGNVEAREGSLTDYMIKDNNKAVIVDENAKDAKLARLEYSVVDNYDPKEENITHTCKLDIKLITGRFHQIRCQLSNMGHPIVGDSLYGSNIQYEKRKAIALVCYHLSFDHPVTGKRLSFSIDL